MDRNTIIGFSLILLIIAGYAYWTAPTPEQQARLQKTTDSLEQVALKKRVEDQRKAASVVKADTTVKKDTAALEKAIGGFASAAFGKETEIKLHNKSLTVSLSSKGGRISSVRLNEFKRSNGKPLDLFDASHSKFYFELQTRNPKKDSEGTLKTDEVYWEAVNPTAESVTMRLKNGNGGYIDQIYSLSKEDFMIDYRVELHGIQNDVLQSNPDLKLTWEVVVPLQEKMLKAEQASTYPAFKVSDESVEILSATSPEQKKIQGKPLWVSFKQQYFNSTLISKESIDKEATVSWKETKESGMLKDMKAEFWLDYAREDKKVYNLAFYFGPNHYNALKKVTAGGKQDLDLERIVPTGWGIFGWVNRWLVIPIFNFLSNSLASMGIVILLLTLIIKSILLPLVYKSYISTAKMRILKPELEAIKEKHNGDMQKMQADNMALYRKAGVSPMSGCIPILLQTPILFALFQFFPHAFELRQKSFLWSHDLSQYDSILNLGFSIPGYGDHISLFTLLMTISTLIYTRLNNQISGVTGQMKWIGYLMPVIFLGVLNDYASGLTWYYFVSNMVTFGQQAIIRRTVNDQKLHAQIAEARKKPVKKSAFQARLEDAMKQAQTKKPQTPPKKKK